MYVYTCKEFTTMYGRVYNITVVMSLEGIVELRE